MQVRATWVGDLGKEGVVVIHFRFTPEPFPLPRVYGTALLSPRAVDTAEPERKRLSGAAEFGGPEGAGPGLCYPGVSDRHAAWNLHSGRS